MYQVFFVDSGTEVEWSKLECEEFFGMDEFPEYLAGYLPHVVILELC